MPNRAIALGLVFLCGFVLTLALSVIDYLLPHFPERDRYVVGQAEFLWSGGRAKAAPRDFYWYPSLAAHVLTLAPRPKLLEVLPDAKSLEKQLRAASEPTVRMRKLVAWVSILIVPGTWLLARRFLGPGAAFFAAALMATSFLYNLYALQGRPHAIQASLALLAVLASLRLWRDPSRSSYLVAGALAALAVGTLHNGFFVLTPLLLAHLLRRRHRDNKRSGWRILLAAVPIAAAVLCFYPFFVEADTTVPKAYSDFALRSGNIEFGPQRLDLANFNGTGFGTMLAMLWWNDPVLLVFAVSGVGMAVWFAVRARKHLATEQRRDLAIVAAYTIPLCCIMGAYAHTFDRYLLPLYPYLAVLAAYAGSKFLKIALSRWDRRGRCLALSAFAGVLVLCLPTYACCYLAWLRARPDTIELAASWIAEHTSPRQDRILTTPGVAFPFFYTSDALERALRSNQGLGQEWLAYQARLPATQRPDPAFCVFPSGFERGMRRHLRDEKGASQYLDSTRVDFAVMEVSDRLMLYPEVRTMLQEVRARGKLVAEFLPRARPDYRTPYLDYQDAPGMLWRTLGKRAFGPVVEIYDLRG